MAGINSGNLTNNAALQTMQVLGITVSSTDSASIDGADITAAEAKAQATYTDLGWDFTTVWKIDEGVSYPKLMFND